MLVVDTGSFSAAARRLNVGQPAVSKLVAQLEERLGVKLLVLIGAGSGRRSASQAIDLPHGGGVNLDAFSHRCGPTTSRGHCRPGRCCQDDRGREPATKSGQAGPFSKLVPAPSQFPYFKLPHATIHRGPSAKRRSGPLCVPKTLSALLG